MFILLYYILIIIIHFDIILNIYIHYYILYINMVKKKRPTHGQEWQDILSANIIRLFITTKPFFYFFNYFSTLFFSLPACLSSFTFSVFFSPFFFFSSPSPRTSPSPSSSFVLFKAGHDFLVFILKFFKSIELLKQCKSSWSLYDYFTFQMVQSFNLRMIDFIITNMLQFVILAIYLANLCG